MTNHITFLTPKGEFEHTEVMRITRDGVFVNPAVSVDDAARTVLDALDDQIKVLVQKAVEDEREACAKVCDRLGDEYADANAADCAFAIRERGAP
jgi:hypothetical protein